MKQIEELTTELKKSNTNMEKMISVMNDMAKDTKDMKGFMHVLVNKLQGMM